METDRIIITKYRTGSHDLRIQKGRTTEEQRNSRLCDCGIDTQTIDHVLFYCPNTETTRQLHNYGHHNLTSFFGSTDHEKTADILKSIDDNV